MTDAIKVKTPNPLVSVIVPVYNVKPYLNACLDSLAAQTMRRIEIILIDDGSDDGSGSVCDTYAGRDERFRVIHQKNGGLSDARNRGILAAAGEYLMFVDSDDWVEKDFCRIPYRMAVDTHADIVSFGYRRIRRGGISVFKDEKMPEGMITRDEGVRMLGNSISCTIWNKLFHRSLFQEVRFPKGFVYEDIAVVFTLFHNAEAICCTNLALYNYRFRKDSISGSRNYSAQMDKYAHLFQQVKHLRRWGYCDLAEQWLVRTAFSWLVMIGSDGRYAGLSHRVIRGVEGFPAYFTANQKRMLRLYRFSLPLFDLVCRVTGRRVRKRGCPAKSV